MLETYPQPIDVDREILAVGIDTIVECGLTCTACADACLGEESVDRLARCIRLDLDCADVCAVTARMLSRHTGADAAVIQAQVQACAAACRACADECTHHAAMHQHCRLCAEACRRAEQACRDLLTVLM
ncbi:four-helix bundle copper-binding protein [Dactylosporangium sp. NPDC000521]|uniref:four-helix bundle copper-binding protein n=1 Tax=Dactylosporangium sp. NPDC000521 TaxID=3363975 RepID=UPI0036A8C8C5